jgi:hypothetical protein
MFKRISELFKPKQTEPETNDISPDELPAWLDNEENTCLTRRTDRINLSREVVRKAREDIIQLLEDIGTEDPEKPLHPKIAQVNRHNLPQFKRKIETAIDQEFSDDDEIYYRQVVEMVDGCFKAFRGPGRYLHLLYAEEIKLFKQSLDQIGRELNLLTDVIKTSRTRLGRIEAIRAALTRYQDASEEAARVISRRKEMVTRREELINEQDRITAEREKVVSGSDYAEYTRRCTTLEADQQRVADLYESLESLIRTALPVWRKALRLVQDEQHRDEEKLLEKLIQGAVLQKYEDPEFLSMISSTAATIFRYIDNEAVPLKNSFEKSLFNKTETYVQQISSSVITWLNTGHAASEEKHMLASHQAATRIAAFDTRIGEITRDIRHLDEEAVKNQGLAHHIQKEKTDAIKVITDEMKELTGGTSAVLGLASDQEESA